ncbi:hypothetical protein DM867_12595 [Halosegnis rubeus]|jgi:hypothetical protein|uniref:Uncharacterized protein n=1 Tax=Halosegnis rubeus TaxID=2212850 RepID=A0A5N5U7X4_9EURY|nr:hypothetical protein [Halosegnis rubeus]KAB7512574.1 hypothetical protein DM867_12595 [Halosegnis rubeus]KAB7514509.1 hypothetical protein DP108_12100 [Halosegnis rubeus]
MSNRRRFARLLRSKLRAAGSQYERAKGEYAAGKASLPTDEQGNARLVCRRYAEKRAVPLEGDVPRCFDADHPDCEGCLADIREGCVETW